MVAVEDVKIDPESVENLSRQIAYGINAAAKKTLYGQSGKIKKMYDVYTPKRTGMLRKNTTMSFGEIETENGVNYKMGIRYRQPYARYQYTHHFVNYTTPNTDGEWDKHAEPSVIAKLKRDFIRNLKAQFR